jgi:hypothetical protein
MLSYYKTKIRKMQIEISDFLLFFCFGSNSLESVLAFQKELLPDFLRYRKFSLMVENSSRAIL